MHNYEEEVNLYFELKGTPESSKESYLRRINEFLHFVGDKEPDEINEKDIQRFILHLKNERHLTPGTTNNYISAIKFFYTHVLEKTWNPRKIPRMRRTVKMPVIPTRQEVMALINTTGNLKHKAILAMIYGSGLRVSEVARLKIGDINSKTMQVRVDEAKHNTNRYTILSEFALEILRQYFKAYLANHGFTANDWLFPGREPGTHISIKTIKNTIIKRRNALKLDPGISSHTLRHCFATHSLEDGVDLAFIQQMMGHRNIKTTAGYLHLTSKSLMGIKSPLDKSP